MSLSVLSRRLLQPEEKLPLEIRSKTKHSWYTFRSNLSSELNTWFLAATFSSWGTDVVVVELETTGWLSSRPPSSFILQASKTNLRKSRRNKCIRLIFYQTQKRLYWSSWKCFALVPEAGVVFPHCLVAKESLFLSKFPWLYQLLLFDRQ